MLASSLRTSSSSRYAHAGASVPPLLDATIMKQLRALRNPPDSDGYGPDRFNLFGTVDASKADVQFAAGLGGAAFGLTPLLAGRPTSKAMPTKLVGYGKDEYLGFSHWVPLAILKKANASLYNMVGLPVRQLTRNAEVKSITRTFWNGNLVNSRVHKFTDPAAYNAGLKAVWRANNKLWPIGVRMLARIPTVWQGKALSSLYNFQRND